MRDEDVADLDQLLVLKCQWYIPAAAQYSGSHYRSHIWKWQSQVVRSEVFVMELDVLQGVNSRDLSRRLELSICYRRRFRMGVTATHTKSQLVVRSANKVSRKAVPKVQPR
jgi:hypothetical protein